MEWRFASGVVDGGEVVLRGVYSLVVSFVGIRMGCRVSCSMGFAAWDFICGLFTLWIGKGESLRSDTLISSSLVGRLKAELNSVTVLTPGSEGYEASLERWCETAEKRAVSLPHTQLLTCLDFISEPDSVALLSPRALSSRSQPQKKSPRPSDSRASMISNKLSAVEATALTAPLQQRVVSSSISQR